MSASAMRLMTAGVRRQDLLYMWGSGRYGQLAVNYNRSPSLAPINHNTSEWSSFSGYVYLSNLFGFAGIKTNGLLYSWGTQDSATGGDNDIGPNIGNNTTFSIGGAVQIGSLSWSSVSKGFNHTAAIRSDGLLFTWGHNNYGQLGDGTKINRSSPVQIGSNSWLQVSVGSGRRWDFYSEDYYDGEEYISTDYYSSWTPQCHTAAIRSDGLLFTWGSNHYGQLGQNNTINRSSPVQVGSNSWTQVSAGGRYTAAIRSGGLLFTWGFNGYGLLGDGTAFNRSSPVQIGSSTWSKVSASESHTLGIRTSGLLFAWGNNDYGQLGTGDISPRYGPTQIGSSTWTDIKAHGFFNANAEDSSTFYHRATSMGLSSGNIYVWGESDFLAGGVAKDNRSSPVLMSATQTFTKIGNVDPIFKVAIDNQNKLYAFSTDFYEILSIQTVGLVQINFSSPVIIGAKEWKQISCGFLHTAAIRSDNLLFTWGLGGYTGDGTGTDRPSPVQIGSSSWTQVSAGRFHTAAIRTDGLLFTWGTNSFGQLGDSTTTFRYSPVQIGSNSWTQVSVGGYHTAAIRTDNLLFTWGRNSYGQLGQNNTINRNSPVQVGSNSWIQVSAGASHNAAIRSDNLLFTWGRNSFGQLGQNNTINRSNPVQVGSNSWTQVSAGGYHTAAIRSNGLLFTWGRNFYGQAGDGSVTSKASPVQIGSNSWLQVSAGVGAFSGGIAKV